MLDRKTGFMTDSTLMILGVISLLDLGSDITPQSSVYYLTHNIRPKGTKVTIRGPAS